MFSDVGPTYSMNHGMQPKWLAIKNTIRVYYELHFILQHSILSAAPKSRVVGHP